MLFLALSFLQMTPWIGQWLLLQHRAPAWIWSVGALISISVMWMIIQWANAKGLTAIRLDLSGWHKRTVFYCFLVGVFSYGIVFFLRLAIGGLEIIGMPSSAQLWRTLVGCLLMSFYIAFSEEIIFRGFIYSNLRRAYSNLIAVSGSLMLFILFHLPKWESLLTSPYVVHLIASGLVFTIVYVKSNTIWHSIGIHWGWNMGAFALIEYKEPIVWTQKLSSYGWLDLSGWVSVLIHSVLILVIIKLYSLSYRRS